MPMLLRGDRNAAKRVRKKVGAEPPTPVVAADREPPDDRDWRWCRARCAAPCPAQPHVPPRLPKCRNRRPRDCPDRRHRCGKSGSHFSARDAAGIVERGSPQVERGSVLRGRKVQGRIIPCSPASIRRLLRRAGSQRSSQRSFSPHQQMVDTVRGDSRNAGVEHEQLLVEQHVDRLPPRRLDHELSAGYLPDHRPRRR